MFDLKNNDISTVLLLIVLGLLIWYLTKPNKTNENFTNDNNSNSASTQQVATVVQQVAPVVQQMAPVVQQMAPVTQQVAPVALQVAPVQPVEPVVQQVNDFQAFDGNYSDNDGADINDAFQPQVPTTNKMISAVDLNKQNVQNYNAKDFLPKEINDQWFDTDFSQAKNNISDDKLINTERYVIGINTVGQSLKNASYDIRGTIANPKFSVSPWNNSTYEPDYNIKPLC